jgi:hypothetical protein
MSSSPRHSSPSPPRRPRLRLPAPSEPVVRWATVISALCAIAALVATLL